MDEDWPCERSTRGPAHADASRRRTADGGDACRAWPHFVETLGSGRAIVTRGAQSGSTHHLARAVKGWRGAEQGGEPTQAAEWRTRASSKGTAVIAVWTPDGKTRSVLGRSRQSAPTRVSSAARRGSTGSSGRPAGVGAAHRRGGDDLRGWGAAARGGAAPPDARPVLANSLRSGRTRGGTRAETHRGRCRAFPGLRTGGPTLVPHIGWNEVRTRSAAFDAYFVHGYWLDADPAAVVGWTEVDGFRFPSLLRAGALTGTQFHPEKSGPTGRALLAAFARGALDAQPAEAAAWS